MAWLDAERMVSNFAQDSISSFSIQEAVHTLLQPPAIAVEARDPGHTSVHSQLQGMRGSGQHVALGRLACNLALQDPTESSSCLTRTAAQHEASASYCLRRATLELSVTWLTAMQELGVGILQDLHRQRETITHAHNTLHGADDSISKARRTLASMSRRVLTNKLIAYGICGLLLAAIILVIYYKFIR